MRSSKSRLVAGLNTAMGKKNQSVVAKPRKEPPATVLIGGHYRPEVRRAMLMVQAKQEVPRNLKQLLGEATNDLCTKYGVPQSYDGEE